MSLTALNGHENGITWPLKRWFDAHDLKRHAAKTTIKWPRVQKLGITWPRVQIGRTDFIRYPSTFSLWLLSIRSGLFADLSMKIGWANPAIGQFMATPAKLCRE